MRKRNILFSSSIDFVLGLEELGLVPKSSLLRSEGRDSSRARDWEARNNVGPLLPSGNSKLSLVSNKLCLVSLLGPVPLSLGLGVALQGEDLRGAGEGEGPLGPACSGWPLGHQVELRLLLEDPSLLLGQAAQTGDGSRHGWVE